MALTSEQQAVFGLAVEKLETEGTKAMDHAAHTCVQTSARAGGRPVIDWAVDYLGCLPEDRTLARLITRAHLPRQVSPQEWTKREIRQCGGAGSRSVDYLVKVCGYCR